MKKIIIILIVVFIGILKFNNYDGILCKEIDIYDISSYVGSNIYEEYEAVSTKEIEVIDYEIRNDGLYIIPLNNNIILPFNGVITTYKNDLIQMDTNYGRVSILGDIKCNLRLYQYYNKNTILGKCNEYILLCDNYSMVVSNLRISYDAI